MTLVLQGWTFQSPSLSMRMMMRRRVAPLLTSPASTWPVSARSQTLPSGLTATPGYWLAPGAMVTAMPSAAWVMVVCAGALATRRESAAGWCRSSSGRMVGSTADRAAAAASRSSGRASMEALGLVVARAPGGGAPRRGAEGASTPGAGKGWLRPPGAAPRSGLPGPDLEMLQHGRAERGGERGVGGVQAIGHHHPSD